MRARFPFQRTRLLTALGAWALAAVGCSNINNQNNSDYQRSPVVFDIDTAAANHPFCQSGKTPFPSVAVCQSTHKYVLYWNQPADTVGLIEYRIYVDTILPGVPGKTWADISQDRTLAAAIMPGSGINTDSIVFVVDDSNPAMQVVPRNSSEIIAIDTTGRVDSTGQLIFALIANYSEGNGPPRYGVVITNDKFPPSPLVPRYTPGPRYLTIDWSRPLDPTSFFDPGADTGIIREYVLVVQLANKLHGSHPVFIPTVHYLDGGRDRSAQVIGDSLPGTNPTWKFILPDSQRVVSRHGLDPGDSLQAVVNGLSPLDTIKIRLWAVDTSGNATDSNTSVNVILTDTTQPTTPQLSLLAGSVTQNRFMYTFTASRDLIAKSDGTLAPAAVPNANIQEYLLTRSGPGGSSVQTTLTIDSLNFPDSVFTDTVRYLPPGTDYRVFVQSVDSTGYPSLLDSLGVTTLPVRFSGADSADSCPPGFIPIPAGNFILGDTGADGDADEKPAASHYLGSYCIEPYEHKDSTGRFAAKVTWKTAEQTCAAMAPADSSHLCTEAEWERACKGSDSVALVYGVQSEQSDPNDLRFECNIGTGDSAMATTPALRNPVCLTTGGVYDMSGNLAEWTLDPYVAGDYAGQPDTLQPGVPLTTPSDTALHGYRGYFYLASSLSPAAMLHQARCSNRDYPAEVRPRPAPGCVDSARPMVAVLYNSPTNPVRCLPIPDSLWNRAIDTVSPSHDSSKVLFLLRGVDQPVSYAMPADTIYQGLRPTDVQLTTLTLAAVTFVNTETGVSIPDTLDAVEMLHDTSYAALTPILYRQIGPPWVPLEQNGQYVIHFLYAYSFLGTAPAQPQYANEVIGFRCCSLPVAAPSTRAAPLGKTAASRRR